MLNTKLFLDEHSSIWNSIPAIVTIRNDMDEIISRIEDKEEAVIAESKGVTEKKAQILNALSLKTSSLSGSLQAYAHRQKDKDLLKHIKVTKSDMLNMAETKVQATVMNVPFIIAGY